MGANLLRPWGEQKKWSIERAELTKKNELAKEKLEKVLIRLKGMR